jgi:hypothetical protein
MNSLLKFLDDKGFEVKVYDQGKFCILKFRNIKLEIDFVYLTGSRENLNGRDNFYMEKSNYLSVATYNDMIKPYISGFIEIKERYIKIVDLQDNELLNIDMNPITQPKEDEKGL